MFLLLQTVRPKFNDEAARQFQHVQLFRDEVYTPGERAEYMSSRPISKIEQPPAASGDSDGDLSGEEQALTEGRRASVSHAR
jgi:hypothetical protein